MSKYITATEAARRLGCTDKTIRTWIKQGKMDAHYVTKNKLAILAADIEVLRRKRENYQEDTSDISHLVARIAELERKCADLEQKYVELATSVAEKAESRAVSQPARVTAAMSRKGAAGVSASVPVNVPDGSVLFANFAERYGIPRATFSHHVKKGIAGDIVATVKRPKLGRPEHTEYWLTPDQQIAALAFWNRHGVKYRQ